MYAFLLHKIMAQYCIALLQVLPSVCSFLRSQPSGDLTRLFERAIPECIYGTHNMDGAGALVFRSVRDWGFHHCSDPEEGLNGRELELAAKTLGTLHASGMGFLAKNGSDKVLGRYPYLAKDMYESPVFLEEVRQHLQIYQELLNSGPDESLMEAREIFSRLRDRAVEWDQERGFALLGGLRRQGKSTLNTLIHGQQ